MSRFIFKLEAVLRQRSHTEKRRQRGLAELQARAARLASQLTAADAQARDTTSTVRANQVGPLDTRLLAEGARFASAIRQKTARLASDLLALQPLLQRAQQALLDAATQRKVLEKLRETQKAQWQAARDHAEARALAEAGAMQTHSPSEHTS